VRLEDPESNELLLILNSRARNMRFANVSAQGVSATVVPFENDTAVEAARLVLPRRFRRGDTLAVSFSASSESQSIQFVIRDETTFASWVERWYPVPATTADGPVSPQAPGSTTLRLPEGWRSVSNGALATSNREGKSVIERWETSVPMARSFVAAPFAEVPTVESGGRRIRFYYLSRRATAGAQAQSLTQALRVMEQGFGPYPYASYSVAEVPEETEFGASSEQGFIMVRSSLLDDTSGSLPLFAHEAAHSWWGNLVQTGGEGSLMADEALAQFGAVRSIEGIEGEAAMRRFLRFSREGYNPLQCALGYFYIQRAGGDKPLAQLSHDKWDHNLADSKGMWIYQMLRDRVGDQIFFRALRSLIQDYAGKQVSLADIRARFLSVSKDSSLQQFFAQWLDRPGAPVLDVEWWSADRGKAIEIRVEQVQAGDPFTFPLEVDIELDDGTVERRTLELSETSQAFKLDTPSRPLGVRLDPQFRILMWRPEYGPQPAT
jgi:aminopeptidase N